MPNDAMNPLTDAPGSGSAFSVRPAFGIDQTAANDPQRAKAASLPVSSAFLASTDPNSSMSVATTPVQPV